MSLLTEPSLTMNFSRPTRGITDANGGVVGLLDARLAKPDRRLLATRLVARELDQSIAFEVLGYKGWRLWRVLGSDRELVLEVRSVGRGLRRRDATVGLVDGTLSLAWGPKIDGVATLVEEARRGVTVASVSTKGIFGGSMIVEFPPWVPRDHRLLAIGLVRERWLRTERDKSVG